MYIVYIYLLISYIYYIDVYMLIKYTKL